MGATYNPGHFLFSPILNYEIRNRLDLFKLVIINRTEVATRYRVSECGRKEKKNAFVLHIPAFGPYKGW